MGRAVVNKEVKTKVAKEEPVEVKATEPTAPVIDTTIPESKQRHLRG